MPAFLERARETSLMKRLAREQMPEARVTAVSSPVTAHEQTPPRRVTAAVTVRQWAVDSWAAGSLGAAAGPEGRAPCGADTWQVLVLVLGETCLGHTHQMSPSGPAVGTRRACCRRPRRGAHFQTVPWPCAGPCSSSVGHGSAQGWAHSLLGSQLRYLAPPQPGQRPARPHIQRPSRPPPRYARAPEPL